MTKTQNSASSSSTAALRTSRSDSTELPYAIVVRYSGEIALKSRSTRQHFVARLASNVAAAVRTTGATFTVEQQRSRIYVYTDDADVVDVVQRVFGVSALGVTRREPFERVEDIIERAVALHADRVRDRVFAVRARRMGPRERFDLACNSHELEEKVGSALFDVSAGVDLDNPEVTVEIELTPGVAWHYLDQERRGEAGLPLDRRNTALCMVSGGFDSGVAAWRMMRRGVALDFCFFNLAGDAHLRGVRDVLRPLRSRWMFGVDAEARIHIIDLRPLVAAIKSTLHGRTWQVALKRLMMLAGDRLAAELGVPAIITGESVAQVSTQTLGNLGAIAHGIACPILRPLVGDNKDAIVELSKHIGTHDAAARNPEFCALEGGKQLTRVSVEKLDAIMGELDLSLLDELVDDRLTLSLDALDEVEIVSEALELDSVPEDATLVDLRPRDQYDGWHYPDALHLPFDMAIAAAESLPSSARYVFVCEVGLKSAFIAERLHERGVRAHNFAGGIKALRRWARREHHDSGSARR